MINQLKVEDAGTYECIANYAANQKLRKTIEVKYYSELFDFVFYYFIFSLLIDEFNIALNI